MHSLFSHMQTRSIRYVHWFYFVTMFGVLSYLGGSSWTDLHWQCGLLMRGTCFVCGWVFCTIPMKSLCMTATCKESFHFETFHIKIAWSHFVISHFFCITYVTTQRCGLSHLVKEQDMLTKVVKMQVVCLMLHPLLHICKFSHI